MYVRARFVSLTFSTSLSLLLSLLSFDGSLIATLSAPPDSALSPFSLFEFHYFAHGILDSAYTRARKVRPCGNARRAENAPSYTVYALVRLFVWRLCARTCECTRRRRDKSGNHRLRFSVFLLNHDGILLSQSRYYENDDNDDDKILARALVNASKITRSIVSLIGCSM